MFMDDPKTPQVNPDVSGHQPLPQPTPDHYASNDVPSLPGSATIKSPRRIPLIPILIAVLVATAIIGSATVFYITANKTTPEVAEEQTVSEVEKGKVSPEDIDTTNNSIDQSLNSTNDSGDFRTEDLTNDTLGL